MLVMPRSVQSVRSTPYSVPRRFGIGSVLMITVAFAVVFAALRAMGFGLLAVMGATIFLMAVGLAQSLYDRKPREASIVTGSLLFPTFAIIGWAMETEGRFADFSGVNVVVCVLAFGLLAPLGMFFGYFAGLLLATVFMFIDMFMSAGSRCGLTEPSDAGTVTSGASNRAASILTASSLASNLTMLDDRPQTP